MKRTIILAAVATAMIFSLSSWAEYKRGNQDCSSDFEEKFDPNSEDLGDQYVYAACTVIKGQDAKGLAILYHLADHKSLVTASFFIAHYLETDGRFENFLTEVQINETLQYYLRTQAIINSIPDYPYPDYWAYEGLIQIELKSIYAVPSIYLSKYEIGAIGDYRRHLLQSPSYQGDRDKETYPKYNSYTLDSLNNMAHYAGECASLPQKKHFDLTRYQATVEACHLFKELALILIPLEEKRQEILLQPKCADLNKTNCPEYYETHQEIADLIGDYTTKKDEIFQPVVANRP